MAGRRSSARGSLQQDRGGAHAQRKQHETAKAERKSDRRRADEAIVAAGAQHVFSERVANGEHVAVKMHRALGHAGGTRGESDQADIVARRVASREALVAVLFHHRFEAVGCTGAPIDDALEPGRERTRLLHLVGQPDVAQRQPDLGLGQRERDFLGAQQRHGRDHDGAGFDHGKIGGDHHRAVRPAQQHAIARHHTEIAREHVGDAVHLLRQIGIGPARGGRDQAIASALARGHPIVDEGAHAIEPIRVIQFRQFEQKFGPLLARAADCRARMYRHAPSGSCCIILPLPIGG